MEIRQMRKCAKGPGPDKDFSYNGIVGNWWLERAADGTHQRAYTNIAKYIRNSIPRDPRLIVDYACGAGNLISRLCRRFPRSRIAGLDGSSLLLGLALKRVSRLPRSCTKRISLIETLLPGPIPLQSRADLVVFCFPNMTLSGDEEEMRSSGFHLSESDQRIAESLSRAREPGDDDCDIPDPQGVKQTLEYGRSVSGNLRRLLARGGTCVRVDMNDSAVTSGLHSSSCRYVSRKVRSTSPWMGRDPGCGSACLPRPFSDPKCWKMCSQTEDERDKNGGYLITILRAI